ncbi:MAG: PilZ domain-containing protein, partial [Chitinivibrionales bacterium]|nr:PilZ domain-containing protein [Chitinivibrionales bacterium]
ILVVNNNEAQSYYEHEIIRCNVSYDVVHTLTDLYQKLLHNAYNGILIDLPTKMMATHEENILVHNELQAYPLLRLKYDNTDLSVRALSYFENQTINSIQAFIQKQCSKFNARCLRANERKPIHFNILLSQQENHHKKDINLNTVSGAVEKTVTGNISLSGCFIITSSDWSVIQNVSLTIIELDDQAPIHAEIRWRVAWGKELSIPGIGVRFTSCLPHQIESLRSWF